MITHKLQSACAIYSRVCYAIDGDDEEEMREDSGDGGGGGGDVDGGGEGCALRDEEELEGIQWRINGLSPRMKLRLVPLLSSYVIVTTDIKLTA